MKQLFSITPWIRLSKPLSVTGRISLFSMTQRALSRITRSEESFENLSNSEVIYSQLPSIPCTHSYRFHSILYSWSRSMQSTSCKALVRGLPKVGRSLSKSLQKQSRSFASVIDQAPQVRCPFLILLNQAVAYSNLGSSRIRPDLDVIKWRSRRDRSASWALFWHRSLR